MMSKKVDFTTNKTSVTPFSCIISMMYSPFTPRLEKSFEFGRSFIAYFI
ncbi:hypothetical protein ACHAWC_010954, partial [Mediolabrus comicus]